MAHCREQGAANRKVVVGESRLGARMRARREKLGLSQDKVAEEIGWFAAQVDDCENGLFRPPSRDLLLLADLLGVDISYFGDGAAGASAPRKSVPESLPQELRDDPGAAKLFSAYARIRDRRKRALLLDLAESFARDD